ncbi:ZIP Zinc transporter family protein [Brugia pahangi]
MNSGSIFKPESIFYGFTSITIISLLSLTGLIFIPLIKGKWRNRWMQVFIALAASSMSSDALLHILPQVVGAHDHSHRDHGHEHRHDHNNFETGNNHSDHHHHHHHHHHQGQKQSEDEIFISDDHSMLLKMTAVIGAVYILYVLEFISASPIWKKKNQTTRIRKISSTPQNAWSNSKSENETSTDSTNTGTHGTHGTIGGIADEPVVMCGLKSAAFVIIFGDAIHNFIDGIAVGASFAISNQVGVATSIAVVCHELPHELGDFAVLIESGLSIPRAMLLNFLSSLTAFAGLFVGLAAISVDSAVEILLAITAGMFLYVAWLDMLIHLKKESASTNDKWYVTLFLQNIGFISGFLIMFIIGWYEEVLASL